MKLENKAGCSSGLNTAGLSVPQVWEGDNNRWCRLSQPLSERCSDEAERCLG